MGKIYTLGKGEIIRGFGVFGKILEAGSRTETEYLTAFTAVNDNEADPYMRAGFFISKKKFLKHTTGTA